MGVFKAEKPMIPKELVWPALMIMPSTNAFEPYTLSQDTSNPAAHPRVNRGKGPLVAMLKVFEPSHKGAIDVFDDHCQALAITAPGLGADGVFELLETLSSRPTSAALKVVPKKVKSLSRQSKIHHFRLCRVKGKSSFRGEPLHRREPRFGLFPAAGKYRALAGGQAVRFHP